MAAGFDIDDRNTWAWTDDTVNAGLAAVDEMYALNLGDPSSFYEFREGVPSRHACPLIDADGTRQVFDPTVTACVAPSSVDEAQIYDWAVSKGYVKDQR